jgi:hypothetical protein
MTFELFFFGEGVEGVETRDPSPENTSLINTI